MSTNLNLDVIVIERLLRVAQTSSIEIDGLLEMEREMTHAQVCVLRAFANGSCNGTLSDLAKALGCSNANAGQIVKGLALREHLRRVRNKDGRIRHFELTPRGYAACLDGQVQLSAEASRALEPLDAREKEQLLALLSKIEGHARTTRSSEESA